MIEPKTRALMNGRHAASSPPPHQQQQHGSTGVCSLDYMCRQQCVSFKSMVWCRQPCLKRVQLLLLGSKRKPALLRARLVSKFEYCPKLRTGPCWASQHAAGAHGRAMHCTAVFFLRTVSLWPIRETRRICLLTLRAALPLCACWGAVVSYFSQEEALGHPPTMGSAASTAVHLVQRDRKTNALLLQYADLK